MRRIYFIRLVSRISRHWYYAAAPLLLLPLWFYSEADPECAVRSCSSGCFVFLRLIGDELKMHGACSFDKLGCTTSCACNKQKWVPGIILGAKRRPVREADNLTAICEQIVWKMWERRPLTNLWAFTACYRDSFTFIYRSESHLSADDTESGNIMDGSLSQMFKKSMVIVSLIAYLFVRKTERLAP
jgi:hypothetical protein